MASESSNITTTTTQSMTSESSTQDMGLDDAAPAQRMLKLISNDNKSFEVPVAFTNLSGLITTSLETDREAKELPLSGVNGNVLAKIVEFLVHHEGKEPVAPEKPLRSKNMKEVCATHVWDADFVDAIWAEDKQLMYDLQMGANYMAVKSLLELCCAKVASEIKGVPLAQIKAKLTPAGKTEEKAE